MTNNRKNQFEELIDAMMIDEVAGLDQDIRKTLENLPIDKKRMAILSILDKDRDMFMKIKKMVDGNDVSKAEHIKNVVEMLRAYVTVGDFERKLAAEVQTPIELVNSILDKIEDVSIWSTPNSTFFDSCTGTGIFIACIIERLMDGLKEWEPNDELRYKHIVENMIYVGELQSKNCFLYLVSFDPKDEYELNIYNGDFLSKEFDEHMKNVWEIDRFNVIISNPPYKGDLHLKFLSKSNDICDDKILFVHPSSWLIKNSGKSKIENVCKTIISNYKSSFELINGNVVFGIKLFMPCVITYISKKQVNSGFDVIDSVKNKNMFFKNVDDINIFSDEQLFFNLKNKILSASQEKNLYNTVNDGEFYVNVSRIRGNVCDKNMIKDDFYTFIPKDRTVQTEKATTDGSSYGFNTEIEAVNFLNYLKSDFARFSLLLSKFNSDLANRPAVKSVPWLDFTQEWNDEKLYNEFGITLEEVEFINKFIPKYY